MKKYYLDIEFCSPVNLISDISFVSGDVKSSTLYFEFYNKGKRVDISGYTLSIKAKRADGVVIASGGKIKENTAIFTPESNIYSVPGKLQMEVALSDASGRYATTKIITAQVIEGFGDAEIEGADNPGVFVKLLTETIAAKEAAEAAAEKAAEKEKAIKENRTHYSESVLLCDYTHTIDSETWDGSDYGGTFVLDKELDVDNLKLYINGEYVPTTYKSEAGDLYYFYANLEDADIFEYLKSQKNIVFPPWIEKTNYQLYEETVYPLDEKYIPDSIPKKANYEKEFICEYTYDSADFEDDYFPGIVVNKKLTGENLAFYVNGEKVTEFYTDHNLGEEGCFWGCGSDWEYVYFYYNFNDDTVAFYPNFEDGTVVQIYAENFKAVKDSDLPNSIARTQYVDKRVDTLEAYYVEEDAFICDYTAVTFIDDYNDITQEEAELLDKTLIVELSKPIDVYKLKMYVNGEVVGHHISDRGNGTFDIWSDDDMNGCMYDGATTISFYSIVPKGTHIQLYEQATVLEEEHIPVSIARVEYVDKKIGDIDAVLDSIIALQESFIKGVES